MGLVRRGWVRSGRGGGGRRRVNHVRAGSRSGRGAMVAQRGTSPHLSRQDRSLWSRLAKKIKPHNTLFYHFGQLRNQPDSYKTRETPLDRRLLFFWTPTLRDVTCRGLRWKRTEPKPLRSKSRSPSQCSEVLRVPIWFVRMPSARTAERPERPRCAGSAVAPPTATRTARRPTGTSTDPSFTGLGLRCP